MNKCNSFLLFLRLYFPPLGLSGDPYTLFISKFYQPQNLNSKKSERKEYGLDACFEFSTKTTVKNNNYTYTG